jgi:hypothetical protein
MGGSAASQMTNDQAPMTKVVLVVRARYARWINYMPLGHPAFASKPAHGRAG